MSPSSRSMRTCCVHKGPLASSHDHPAVDLDPTRLDPAAVGFQLLAAVGYAADRVRAVELVTPDGRMRRVTADHDAELFWALRGLGTPLQDTVTELPYAASDRVFAEPDRPHAYPPASRTRPRRMPTIGSPPSTAPFSTRGGRRSSAAASTSASIRYGPTRSQKPTSTAMWRGCRYYGTRSIRIG
ncbi:hypothetical protein FOE78_11365 [Microlunatus elymi]|uniref:Uncharacterized protein n=1 Tax=Microlunatus elymi TaxID=2596828 RepID=A0A516PZ49_9ACTN|nr:hypothetical protein FOE78_11365 [Microlunatus elymi]